MRLGNGPRRTTLTFKQPIRGMVVCAANAPAAIKNQALRAFHASGWRPHLSDSLQGFVDLHQPSGLVIHDCTLHQKSEKHWVLLPGKPQIEDGRRRIDPATGDALYTPVVEIPDRATREGFTAEALAAVDRLLRQ
jgi:hypothetical protein